MTLVDECASDCARSTVEIFVRAPTRKVSTPVVQRKRDIANGVRKIPSALRTDGVRCARDTSHIQHLPCVVLNASQYDEREFVSDTRDGCLNVFVTQAFFAVTRRNFDHIDAWIAADRTHKRVHGKSIAWKCAAFHHDSPSRTFCRILRAIKTHQEKMQIDCQRIHRDHFVCQRARQFREMFAKKFVIFDPRTTAVYMSLRAHRRPVVEFFVHTVTRCARHQAKRIANEIRQRFAFRIAGDLKRISKRRKRVVCIAPQRKFARGFHIGSREIKYCFRSSVRHVVVIPKIYSENFNARNSIAVPASIRARCASVIQSAARSNFPGGISPSGNG